MSYMTFSSQEKHLFYCFHTFTHIGQHYFSKYWGDEWMGRPPPQTLGRPSPSPLRFPPLMTGNSLQREIIEGKMDCKWGRSRPRKILLDWMMSKEYSKLKERSSTSRNMKPLEVWTCQRAENLKKKSSKIPKNNYAAKNGIGGAPTNYRRRRRADQQKSAAAAPTNCRRRRRGAAGARL